MDASITLVISSSRKDIERKDTPGEERREKFSSSSTTEDEKVESIYVDDGKVYGRGK